MKIVTRKRGSSWSYSFETAKIDGKRRRFEKGGFRTQKLALAEGTKALEEYNRSGSIFEPSIISVNDYYNLFYEQYVKVNLRSNTWNAYDVAFRIHILPRFASYRLQSLTTEVIQQFINDKVCQGLSRSMVESIKGCFNQALRYAVVPLHYIKTNPMDFVRIPKIAKDQRLKRIILKDSEIDLILNRFPFPNHFNIILLLGLYGGLRVGESVALTWDKVDFDNSTITIDHALKVFKGAVCDYGETKTASSVRTIKIGETLLNALKTQYKWQRENELHYGEFYEIQSLIPRENETEYGRILESKKANITPYRRLNFVCTKETGELINTDTVKYMSRVIHHELGLEFNPHSLRHTHATRLIENGANIKSVSKRLGHQSVQITLDTYVHDTDQLQKETVDILESALSTNNNFGRQMVDKTTKSKPKMA